MRSSPHQLERVALLSIHSSPLARIGTGDAGGMNLYVRRLADELAGQGLKVDIFTRRTDPRQAELVPLPSGARVVHLDAGAPRPIAKKVLPLRVPELVDGLRRFAQREGLAYDLLHSHYWISGLVAIRFAALHDVPVLHMFHTLSKVKQRFLSLADPTDSELRADAEGCIIGRAEAIIGATAEEACLMEGLYGKRPQRFAIIPPGVDTNVFRPHDELRSRQLLKLDGERIVLFVGRPDRIKRLDILLRSVAELREEVPGLRLVVVGDHRAVGRQLAGEHTSLIRDLHLKHAVEFRGVVTPEELPLYYSAADICAVTSAYESFCMVATESMACQTPVVAFGVGGLVGTIRDGRTGFLAEPEHGELVGEQLPSSTANQGVFTAKLRQALLNESTNLEAMGRQARLSVQRFDWSTIASRTRTLYEQVVHEYAYAYPMAAGDC